MPTLRPSSASEGLQTLPLSLRHRTLTYKMSISNRGGGGTTSMTYTLGAGEDAILGPLQEFLQSPVLQGRAAMILFYGVGVGG